MLGSARFPGALGGTLIVGPILNSSKIYDAQLCGFNSLDDITAILLKCFMNDYINCYKTEEAKSELKTKDDLSIKLVGGR